MRAGLLDKVIYGIPRSITLTTNHPTDSYYKKVAWTNLPCTLSYDSQDRVMRPSRNSLSFHGVTPVSRISASYSFHLFAPHT